jgi:hybrid polyketide synthase/nonribosomal peptide synthetase ACE1
VIAYHRLVGDGSTTENLFVEVGQLYDGVALDKPSVQFADLSARQREALTSGKMDDDIEYWASIHGKASLSPSASVVLPFMTHLTKGTQAGSEPQGDLGTWHQHEAIARLDPMVAFRIKERSRKHKSTPMQFFLATYHVLLARLTDSSEDITIGIADTNRTTIEETSAMGYFANLLPLRFHFAAHMTFGEHLVSTRERTREAMQHSRVPVGVLLERLGAGLPGLKDGEQRAPVFQAVFDYKQGQAESGSIGGATMTEVIASRERTPYDVVLEMSDDPKRDPLITVKLRSDLYGPQQPKAFLDSYVALLSMFSMNPALKLA